MIFQRIILTSVLAATLHAHAQSLTDGVVAYYKEDSQGGHPDSTGAYHGSPIGTIDYTWSGKIGGASTFAGNNSINDPRVQALLPNVPSWTAGTFSAWVRHTSYASNNNYTIAQISEGANWGHLWLYISPLGTALARRAVFHVGTGQGYAANAISTTELNDNTWYHLVATWDKNANTAKLYVNGNLEATASVPAWGAVTSDFYWGSGFNGYGVNGSIDEIGVWNRALSPTNVTSLFNSGTGRTYPFTTSTSARTMVVGFTGFGNMPLPTHVCSGTTYDLTRQESSRGITTLLQNIVARGNPNVEVAAFTYYNVYDVPLVGKCKAPWWWQDHEEAQGWLASLGPFSSSDRLIVVGHSYGGYRAWLFVEQVKRQLGLRAHALYVADPIMWDSLLGNYDPESISIVDQKNLFLPAPDVSGPVKVYRQPGAWEKGFFFSGMKIQNASEDFVFPRMPFDITSRPDIPKGVQHSGADDAEIFHRRVMADVFRAEPVYPGVTLTPVSVLARKETAPLLGGQLRIRILFRNDGALIADKLVVEVKYKSASTLHKGDTMIRSGALQEIELILPLRDDIPTGTLVPIKLSWSTNHVLDSEDEIAVQETTSNVYIQPF